MNDIEYRHELEILLLSIAKLFIDVTTSDIDAMIKSSLSSIVRFTNVDRGYVYLFRNNNQQLEMTYHFNQPDTKAKIPLHDKVDSDDFSWFINSILENKTIKIHSLSMLGPKATTIKLIMQSEKVKSMIVCPLYNNENKSIGYVGLDSVKKEMNWTDDIEYMLKNCSDIFVRALDRKKAVELGKESEEKLSILFERIEDGIFVINPNGKFVELNPAGVKMLGYSTESEVLALDIETDLFESVYEKQKFLSIINSEGRVKDYELNFKKKSGEKIAVVITATASFNKFGKINAFEGILRDVTEKINLQKQLFQAQKMESIGLLAGGIAHDFNNILTAINGYSEMILLKMEETNPFYKYVSNIIKTGKRASSLIKQLLAFSRKQVIELKVVDINFVINDLNKMLSRLIREDIVLEINLSKDVGLIKADTTQIQQILVNLLLNADHAIRELREKNRKNTITISTEPVSVNESNKNQYPGNMEGNYVLISVSDTGTGMDEKTKQRIYDPFFTTKKEGVGTGLGLSTVYGIVKQNNCQINVESELGIGTYFNIYWPVTIEKKKTEIEIDSDYLIGKRSGTLLVVEDDKYIREVACDALTTIGYKVYEAENGIAALNLIESENLIDKIDVVISDIVMPEMGGEELAAQINMLNPQIKILLCSGYTESRIFTEQRAEDEKYHFLAKPYTLNKLEKTILQLMKKSSVNEETEK